MESRHWLTRAAKNSKWTVLNKLGRGDELVEVVLRPEMERVASDLHVTPTRQSFAMSRGLIQDEWGVDCALEIERRNPAQPLSSARAVRVLPAASTKNSRLSTGGEAQDERACAQAPDIARVAHQARSQCLSVMASTRS
ncbi:MAG: hypothetical protein RL385_4258 [Pseudomonadota bacterium]